MPQYTSNIREKKISLAGSEFQRRHANDSRYNTTSGWTAHNDITSQFKSSHAEQEKLKTIRYMNTYRLESKKPFNVDEVKMIINDVILPELQDIRYDPTECSKLCIKLTSKIRHRVKLQAYDRYKIICRVVIGEKNRQGVNDALRFLWDPDKDNYTNVTFENFYLFAIVAVFAVYYN